MTAATAYASQITISLLLLMWTICVRSSSGRGSEQPLDISKVLTKAVNPGERLEMPCPVMTPQWVRNGQPLTRIEFDPRQRIHWSLSARGQTVLVISRAARTDSGLWECMELAGPTPKRVQATNIVVIADEPDFSLSREPSFGLPIIEGMNVSFRCDVVARPPPIRVRWVKDGDLNLNLLPRFGADNEGLLTLSSVRIDDSGWYRCIADHSLGQFASYSLYLNVRSSGDMLGEKAPLNNIIRTVPSESTLCRNAGSRPSTIRLVPILAKDSARHGCCTLILLATLLMLCIFVHT